jgi:hypothetical protein
MPSDGTIGGLVGKLLVLRVECPTCGRYGRYHVAQHPLSVTGNTVRLLRTNSESLNPATLGSGRGRTPVASCRELSISHAYSLDVIARRATEHSLFVVRSVRLN